MLRLWATAPDHELPSTSFVFTLFHDGQAACLWASACAAPDEASAGDGDDGCDAMPWTMATMATATTTPLLTRTVRLSVYMGAVKIFALWRD
jgi:hypothetical protein